MKTPFLKIMAFGSMGLLMLVLIVATLLEKLYGTSFAIGNIYHSAWFIAIWSLLTVSAMVYTLRVSKRLTLISLHASFAIILVGAFVSFMTSRHGSIVIAKESVPASMFTTPDGILEKLPFSLQLADIDTIYPKGDGQHRDYVARLTVNDKKESNTRTISLNNPLKIKGFSLCIKGVTEGNLSLLVAHDTIGLHISYAGYLMMFVSFIMLFLDKRSGFRKILQQLKENKAITSKRRISIFKAENILFIATSVFICMRWLRTEVFPATNGAESMILLAWATTLLAIAFRRKGVLTHVIPLLSALSCIAVLTAFASGLGKNNEIQPILRSPLLSIHVTAIIIAYALLLCTAINAVIALAGNNKERAQTMALFGRTLLYPATMLLATGIFIGAVWANISWGRYWGWDPKEVWALITLLCCSFAFHTRSLPFMAKPLFFHIYCIAVFVIMLFTYLGVNYLLGGMHSYM